MLSVSNIQSNKLNYEAQLLLIVFITVKPNRLATILVGLILVGLILDLPQFWYIPNWGYGM